MKPLERKVSSKKYLIAFILTIFIFVGGIFIGIFFENLRLSDSEQSILQEKVNLRSLQLQQKYIETGGSDCNTLNEVLETNINELTKKMNVVIEYEKRSVFNEKEFHLQLRDYFLTEIQFLLTANDIEEKCGKDNVKIIYFYDQNQFDTQGSILDYVKKKFGSRVLVFSFNSAFADEPMINILLTNYNITQFPSLIINDQVYQGHTPVKGVLEYVCEEFQDIGKEIPKECRIFL